MKSVLQLTSKIALLVLQLDVQNLYASGTIRVPVHSVMQIELFLRFLQVGVFSRESYTCF